NIEGPALDCKSDLFDIYEFHNYGKLPAPGPCSNQYDDAEWEIKHGDWDTIGNRKAFEFSSDNCNQKYQRNDPVARIRENLIYILREANKIQRVPWPMYLPYIGSFAHTEYMDAYCENCDSLMAPEDYGIDCVVNNEAAKTCSEQYGQECSKLNIFQAACFYKKSTSGGSFSGGYTARIDDDLYEDIILWTDDPQLDIFLNDGSGNLVYADSIVLSNTNITSAISIDFDDDSDLDLVVGANSGAFLYENDGYGNFNFYPGINLKVRVEKMKVIDINPAIDTYDDLAITTNSGVNLYINDESGNFALSGTIPTSGYSIIDGDDLNGDTYPDLVIAVPNIETRVYFNDGFGGFSSGPLLDVNATTDIAIADFDGDLNPDVYVATIGSDDILFLNTYGTGIFTSTNFPDFQNTISVSTLDYDDDGNMDFFLGDTTQALVIRNELDNPDYLNFLIADTFNIEQETYEMLPFDADNDGDGELFIISEFTTSYYENILNGGKHMGCGTN
ncbi:MAG: hypothetical protein A2161_03930, partial [Candidatus Schekmanbacteria bacterium RBG_13_48_7]